MNLLESLNPDTTQGVLALIDAVVTHRNKEIAGILRSVAEVYDKRSRGMGENRYTEYHEQYAKYEAFTNIADWLEGKDGLWDD